MNTSLYVIEDSLQQLAELREQAEYEGDSEALKLVDDQIACYLSQEAAKINSYVGLIRTIENQITAAELERGRIHELEQRLGNFLDRLKANALAVMQQFGVKELKDTRTGRGLRRQANGGRVALEVPDVLELPEEYRKVTMRVPPFFVQMFIDAAKRSNPAEADKIEVDLKPQIVDTEAIRKALAQRVRCPECAEYQDTATGRDLIARDPCPRCNGAGTIQNTVPGARLLERGEHVRLS